MKTPGLIEAVRRETRALLGGYIDADRLRGDLGEIILPPAPGDNAGVTGALLLAARGLAWRAGRRSGVVFMRLILRDAA